MQANTRNRNCVAVAIGMALLLPATSSTAKPAYMKTAAPMHADHDDNAAVVGKLKGGVAVDASKCGLFWCYVAHAKTSGWVRAKYIGFPTSSNRSGGGEGGGGGGGGAGNAGGIGNAAAGGMIWQFVTRLFGE